MERIHSYVVATEHNVPNDGVTDASDAIQKLINDNPNRTLYFPDGTYLLTKPILTPAEPTLSVSLELSAYAVFKASNDWNDTEAMVRLGAKDPANNIYVVGSNYYIQGGFIDGNDRANGISIDGGRETAIRNINIKRTHIGIYIKHGANNGSSDADINQVNITGDGTFGSIGVLVEGYDNTATNMRIAKVQFGIVTKSGGNSYRNIHPLFIYSPELGTEDAYQQCCGFVDHSSANWYNYCYSDQFNTGFQTTGNGSCIFNNCFVFWYSEKHGKNQTAFHALKKFNSIITDFRVGFRAIPGNILLKVDEEGGTGSLVRPVVNEKDLSEDSFKTYLTGNIVAPH